jgi:hypothetical protein
VQIPLALVLVSVKWWENFVDTDRGCLRLFAFKRVCKDVRTKMDTVTSVTAIVATIGLVYLLEYVDGRQLTTALLYGDPRTNGELSSLLSCEIRSKILYHYISCCIKMLP